jgi:hypothetical protein
MTNDNSPEELLDLWQSQRSEFIPMPVEELRKAFGKLTSRVYWRNIREYSAAILVVAGFGYYFWAFHTVLLRIGSGLTIAGAVFMSVQLHRKGSAANIAEEMESKTCLEFYRSALARQRDLLSFVWKWYLLPFAPGMILFLLGLLKLVLDQPASHLHYGLVTLWFGITFAGCASVFALVGWLNRRGAKDLQKRIDALDTARIES